MEGHETSGKTGKGTRAAEFLYLDQQAVIAPGAESSGKGASAVCERPSSGAAQDCAAKRGHSGKRRRREGW